MGAAQCLPLGERVGGRPRDRRDLPLICACGEGGVQFSGRELVQALSEPAASRRAPAASEGWSTRNQRAVLKRVRAPRVPAEHAASEAAIIVVTEERLTLDPRRSVGLAIEARSELAAKLTRALVGIGFQTPDVGREPKRVRSPAEVDQDRSLARRTSRGFWPSGQVWVRTHRPRQNAIDFDRLRAAPPPPMTGGLDSDASSSRRSPWPSPKRHASGGLCGASLALSPRPSTPRCLLPDTCVPPLDVTMTGKLI